jgi:hypothetical protein
VARLCPHQDERATGVARPQRMKDKESIDEAR